MFLVLILVYIYLILKSFSLALLLEYIVLTSDSLLSRHFSFDDASSVFAIFLTHSFVLASSILFEFSMKRKVISWKKIVS